METDSRLVVSKGWWLPTDVGSPVEGLKRFCEQAEVVIAQYCGCTECH